MVDFSFLDWAVVALFFAAVLTLGFSAKLKENTSVQMVAAGRALTMPLFVATLITTWYGGVLGTPEFYNGYFGFGLGTLTVNGLPYWIAGIVFSLYLAKRIRGEAQISIPERIEQCYGKAPALVAAVLVMVLATPAAFLFMLGTLLVVMFGWPLWLAVTVAGIGSTLFLYKGGLMADARSNTISFVMMYSAFIMILVTAIGRYGMPWDVIPELPETQRQWDGGHGIFVVISFMFLGAWTFVDPGFHQRVAAVKDEASARRGVLLAVLFWIVFDTLTTLTAMYGTLAMLGSDPSLMGTKLFPLFGDMLLPSGMKGVFFAGMFGAIVAAIIGYTFVSGTTAGRDFFARLKGDADEFATVKYTRVGIAVATLLGIALAISVASVVDLWYKVASLIIPGLLVPVVGAYAFKKPPAPKVALACLVIPPLTAAVWTAAASRAVLLENAIFGTTNKVQPVILTPILVGILIALLIWGIGSIVYRNSDDERRPDPA